MYNPRISKAALLNPLFSIDFYKVGHKDMEPEGNEINYVNMTPRNYKYAPVLKSVFDDAVVVFGVQARLQDLHERFNEGFFRRSVEEVIAEYKEVVDDGLFTDMNADHIRALHNLGYLPMEFRALPEGTLVPAGVPVLVMWNTHKDFSWLPTYLETDLSHMWKDMTNATIARNYRMIFERWHGFTGTDGSFVPWQGHDFSARGLDYQTVAAFSGMAHLSSFFGTDTVSALPAARYYYGVDTTKNFLGHSVRASEHSVTCMGGAGNELETFRGWIKKFNTGIMSLVSDTWDYWDMVNVKLPSMKDDIMARDGKLVVRPDSGDPYRIVVGYFRDELFSNGDGTYRVIGTDDIITDLERRGTVDVLAEHFGVTINEAGYMTLDSHIGVIYGDSITPERAENILRGLAFKGYTADNIVFGIGSYTYQMNSRDSFGFALKSTFCYVNGEKRSIQKNPKTGDGTKKSAAGALRVVDTGKLELVQDVDFNVDTLDYDSGLLVAYYKNGVQLHRNTLSEIRARLWNNWSDAK